MNRVTTLGELAASFSHELKQPITATMTNANTGLRWLNLDKPDLAEVREAIEYREGRRPCDRYHRSFAIVVQEDSSTA